MSRIGSDAFFYIVGRFPIRPYTFLLLPIFADRVDVISRTDIYRSENSIKLNRLSALIYNIYIPLNRERCYRRDKKLKSRFSKSRWKNKEKGETKIERILPPSILSIGPFIVRWFRSRSASENLFASHGYYALPARRCAALSALQHAYRDVYIYLYTVLGTGLVFHYTLCKGFSH